MWKKLAFGVFFVAFLAWLAFRPQLMPGATWKDCITLKGIICIPN